MIFEFNYLKFLELLNNPMEVFALLVLELIEAFKPFGFPTLTLRVSMTNSFC